MTHINLESRFWCLSRSTAASGPAKRSHVLLERNERNVGRHDLVNEILPGKQNCDFSNRNKTRDTTQKNNSDSLRRWNSCCLVCKKQSKFKKKKKKSAHASGYRSREIRTLVTGPPTVHQLLAATSRLEWLAGSNEQSLHAWLTREYRPAWWGNVNTGEWILDRFVKEGSRTCSLLCSVHKVQASTGYQLESRVGGKGDKGAWQNDYKLSSLDLMVKVCGGRHGMRGSDNTHCVGNWL